MSSLKNLPMELIRHIVLNLEHPSDLLHIALTCKFFHEVIIVTRHLHLTKISCSDADTPLKFWRTLCAKSHYASMIRHLELVIPSFSLWDQFQGRRIDEEFADDLATDSLLPVSAPLSPHELILKSLNYMDGLKYFAIHKRGKAESTKVYDYLRHVSKNSLEALHVVANQYPSSFIPQYKLSDFSFHSLTSFSLRTSFPDPTSESHPFALLLTSLAVDCPTLVNCALRLLGQPFPICYLVKKVAWPSLKRLTLVGMVQLTDAETSREENINSYISFLARHSKLERLYLALLNIDAKETASELCPRLHGLLPSLRSLHWSGPIPLDILCRLESIDRIYIPPDHYQLAQSLRNCVFDLIDYGDLQALIKVMPQQLERLSVTISNEAPLGHPEYFESLLEELPKVLSRLINLTHLEIHFDRCSEDLGCSPEVFIDYLPSLAYFRFTTYVFQQDGWVHVTVDDSSVPYTHRFDSLEGSTDKSHESGYWADFFMGDA